MNDKRLVLVRHATAQRSRASGMTRINIKVEADLELWIDVEALYRALADRALFNASGRARLKDGSVELIAKQRNRSTFA